LLINLNHVPVKAAATRFAKG